MRYAAGLFMLASLGACQHEHTATAVTPPSPTAECAAGKAQSYVGQAATPALAEAARQVAGARAVRTIAPGMMVTMDYRGDRLNLTADAKGVIVSVRCG